MAKGSEIEKRSFEIIASRMKKKTFQEQELPIVMRVIHATGDFDFETNIRFHPLAVEAGMKSLRAGKDILVDVNMVASGINRGLLKKYGGRVVSRISEIEDDALVDGQTRAEAAIESAANDNIGIVAIGNAPTALLKTMELVEEGRFKPDLVIGVPVGFVSAEESKETLSKKPHPFITTLGRKGGSSVAVAVVNGILRLMQ